MNPSADQAPNLPDIPTGAPSDRASALRLTGELFARIRSGHNLNVEQKRSILYVLRHYPDRSDIRLEALMQEFRGKKGQQAVIWMAPETGD